MNENSQPLSDKQRILQRKEALWTERSSWIDHYREISTYMLPRAGRYFVTDRNLGTRRNTKIYDNTPVFGLRTMSAGMMAGATSPARPWFRLRLSDRKLMEKADIKRWLHQVEDIMRDVFAASNTYTSLPVCYEELGAFGTDAMFVEEDFENVVHTTSLTAGEYAIATDDRGRVNTIYREFQMTVGQMVRKFGIDNCSTAVQTAARSNRLDDWHTVIHAIEPREDRDPKRLDVKNARWRSVYVEPTETTENKFLRDSGFRRFPAVVSRWVVTAGDIYGTSPGMDALGDSKQLQHEQLRKSQAIDYQTNPPLVVPVGLKDAERSRLPGGIFYGADNGQGQSIRSAFEVRLDLNALREDIADVRERINKALFVDLFLMLNNIDRTNMTATEVAERHEEKLLMLGPVLERMHNEKLGPLIDLVFDRCVDAGILPPPPAEIESQELSIEFTSVLAQAQRAVGAASTDRVLGVVASMMAIDPRVKYKINTFQAVDDYADAYGANPEIIRTDDEAEEMAAAEAQAAAAAQMAQAAPGMAKAAKDASEVNTGNLQDIASMTQGYSTPGVTA